jgi:hypothetical protein
MRCAPSVRPAFVETTLGLKSRSMDMLDIVAESGLEWIYDKVERRYGRAAAWLATLALAAAIVAIFVTVLVLIL